MTRSLLVLGLLGVLMAACSNGSGNIGATYRLADSYRTGVGIEKDPVKAVQ